MRDTLRLRLEDAASSIQRSTATISRIERGELLQVRYIDVSALLDFYAARDSSSVTPEIRERVMRLVARGREAQWFEPFRDVISGDMTDENMRRYVEYETDAAEIVNFEPELIPGLLQTREYALAVAEAFFPGHPRERLLRFAEFRVARQRILTSNDAVTYSAAFGESALKREFGNASVRRGQLEALLQIVAEPSSNMHVYVIPDSVVTPAAFGGPFVVMHPRDTQDGSITYLETRSGGDYLTDPDATDRFMLYFGSLTRVALPDSSVQELMRTTISSLE